MKFDGTLPDVFCTAGPGRWLWPLLFLVLLAYLSTYQFLWLGFLPETPNNDLARHLALADNFFAALSSGQLLPRLQPADHGFPDLPVFQYYGFMTGVVSWPFLALGLPSLPALVLGVLVFRVFGLSGVYLSARLLGGTRLTALAAAAIYSFTPYVQIS